MYRTKFRLKMKILQKKVYIHVLLAEHLLVVPGRFKRHFVEFCIRRSHSPNKKCSIYSYSMSGLPVVSVISTHIRRFSLLTHGGL